jgi:hypothetical protein
MSGMATAAKKGWGTAPFAVALVAVIALCKAFFVLFMGIIGVAASSKISNPFGIGMIVFAVVYAAIALMLVRGSRFARDVLGLLSVVAAVVAIVWAFNAPNSAVIEALVTLGFAILVLVLLFVPERVKAYFRKT